MRTPIFPRNCILSNGGSGNFVSVSRLPCAFAGFAEPVAMAERCPDDSRAAPAALNQSLFTGLTSNRKPPIVQASGPLASLSLSRGGFSLLELMVVLVLMTVIVSAVAISFRGPVRDTQMTTAIATLRSLDHRMRYSATNSNERKLMVLDLKKGVFESEQNQTRLIHLPRSVSIKKVYVSSRDFSSERLQLPYFQDGSSLTWAVLLDNGSRRQWILFAGRSGQVLTPANEDEVASIFDVLRTWPLEPSQ